MLVQYVLEIQVPSFRKLVFLNKPTYSIGHSSGNSIVLPFKNISSYHATLVKITEERTNRYFYSIFDGNLKGNRSENGTFVNQERCLARELKPGDVIEFASSVRACYYSVPKNTPLFARVDQRQYTEATFQKSEELYNTIFRSARERILLVDAASKRILEANAAFRHLLGYTEAEIVELTLYDVVALDRAVIEEIERSVTEQDFIRELPHRRKDNSLLTVEASISPIGYDEQEMLCFVVRDITERKQLEERLQEQASRDPLTGLLNRSVFDNQLSIAVANAIRYQYLSALMFLDLDGFKNVNDNLGHDIGDRLLQDFSQRTKSCLRTGDLFSRWGGDEFVVLVPQLKTVEEAATISQRILNVLNEPFYIEEQRVEIRSSIGIALCPEDGEDAETLLQHADRALYRVKAQGGNNYNFYSSTRQI